MPVGTETDVTEMRGVETSDGDIDSPANETLQKEIRDEIAQAISNAASEIKSAQIEPIADRGTKIQLPLGVDESVKVPDGVYWVVSIGGSDYVSIHGDQDFPNNKEIVTSADGNSNATNSHITDVTLHEKSTIQAEGGGGAFITGWEVPY